MNATRLLQFISARLTGRRLDWTLVAIAFLLAVLPARLLAPWTSDVARIVSVPIVPLMHLGMATRDAIRPPREAFDHRAPEVIALEMQAEAARTLFEQARLRVESLEREVATLKGAREPRAERRVIHLVLKFAARLFLQPAAAEFLQAAREGVVAFGKHHHRLAGF